MNGSCDATRALTELEFIGERTAGVLAADDIDASDIERKRVSYTDLVDAGVNPGVAGRIRRAHSLPWSFTSTGDDLARRSTQVRGLGAAERAWVAASSGDWEDGEAAIPSVGDDGCGAGTQGSQPPGSVWDTMSRPTPISTLSGIDDDIVEQFHEGGIRSIRRLATIDPVTVADALPLNELTVRYWRAAARRYRD